MDLRVANSKAPWAAILLLCSLAWSIPALNKSWTITQSDGSTVEIQKFGNEHFNYTGTTDGYPVRRDRNGDFRYIDENGDLTEIRATHEHQKENEKNFRRKHSSESIRSALYKKASYMAAPSADDDSDNDSVIPMPDRMPAINNNIRNGEKRALVILVEFNDTRFTSDDPQTFFYNQLNAEGFNTDNSVGSARDYFIQNSQGLFEPTFDVVGPITLAGDNYKTYGQLSTNGNYGAQIALSEAIDSLVKRGFDFSVYDNDGDRTLDFVQMIYAGFGSHDSDQDSAIWPHKWVFRTTKRIGSSSWFSSSRLSVKSYACSAELDGYSRSLNKNAKKLAGVGTFLHEFSHLMGLPDFYSKNTASLYTPSKWSIMDAGAYNSGNLYGPLATSPPYYSAFERMSLGWMNATDLDVYGPVKMAGIQNNVALRIANPTNSDEFFLLEYRTDKLWDAALPNHGMLIWHIDYNRDAWANAAVNTTERQRVDIEEADGIASKETASGDAFPGRNRIKTFDKFILWDNTDLEVSLSGITESRDHTYISFNVSMNAPEGELELLEGTEIDITLPEEDSSSSETLSSSEETLSSSSSDNEESSSSNIEIAETLSSSNSSGAVFGLYISSDHNLKGTTGVPQIASGSAAFNLHVTRHKSKLILTGLPDRATVNLFSVNGQLLYRKVFVGGNAEIDTRPFAGPFLVKVN